MNLKTLIFDQFRNALQVQHVFPYTCISIEWLCETLVQLQFIFVFFVTLDSYNRIVDFVNMDRSFHHVCSS